jgi:virulence-associated protein VapD
MPNIKEISFSYLKAGLSVLPANVQLKFAALSGWKQYQQRLPYDSELASWFSNGNNGVCIVTGKVSGNLEMIDFDIAAEMFEPWQAIVKKELPALLPKLVIEKSQSGGRHVIYRCEDEICKSLKLAKRKITVDSNDEVTFCGKKFKPIQDKDGSWYILPTYIETRGEGGLFLCAPTPGYELIKNDFTEIPVISAEDRDILLSAALSLNEYVPEPIQPPQTTTSPSGNLRPGDDYNTNGDIREVLLQHGWQCYQGGENEHWCRPGKTSGTSATLKNRVFYVFSTNAHPFESEKAYSPFSVYTLLEHNGDFAQAARALAQQGYGQRQQDSSDVDISGIVGKDLASESSEWQDDAVSLSNLITDFSGLNPPIIHGLLREGETMNIIAAPKVGKSWLVNSLSIAIATGLDWLGFKVEQGSVLVIDNELHVNTLTYRYMELAKAMKLNPKLFSQQVKIKSLRGQLKDLMALSEYFQRLKPNAYKVIILDAFYRTLPDKTDENDNGAIARLYNSLDCHAMRLNCAFVLIHHTSKGNQSQKSITDVGAGAGSQSRAVDTHVILRPHEDEDKIVMDAVVRSWAPLESLVLRKQHPLFEVDTTADPTALLGAEKKREPKKEVLLNEFVDTCIGSQDPCLMSDIVRLASKHYDLSERKTKTMVDSAIDENLAVKIHTGSRIQYTKFREGFSGEKGQWVAALLSRNPDADIANIAHLTGASQRYIRMVKNGNDAEMAGNDFRDSSTLTPDEDTS